MQFEERQEQEGLIIRPLERRLDASVIQEFKLHIAGKVQEGHLLIALDLSDVEFIDSSGLGGIISVLRTVGENGRVAIFGARPNILTFFRLTRMDRIFPISDSAAEALRDLAI